MSSAANLRSFEFAGCTFHFVVEGNGPPVVFIQGVGLHGRGWSPQTDQLHSEFQCLTFDNRGMGSSQPFGTRITVPQMAQDTLELMTYVGWHSAHLVGHSLGGPVALEMALSAPGRVRSLSLLCTVARGSDATRVTRRMLWLGLRSRLGSRSARRRAFLQIVLPPGSHSRAEADSLARKLEPIFGHDLAEQPPVALKQLSALRGYDASSKLQRLASIPTLVVSAAHDPIAPPRFGRALAAAISGARYVECANASHGLPIQHATHLNAILRKHIATAEGQIERTGDVST